MKIALYPLKKNREDWISKGAIWFRPKEKPQIWDAEKQLLDIPHEFL
jgi:hypothetical protein